MKYLLLGGAQSVGKTQTIRRLYEYLLEIGFEPIEGQNPNDTYDFWALLERVDSNSSEYRILINSASDTVGIIKKLNKHIKMHGEGCDLLISSVRDAGNWPRNEFFEILNISEIDEDILEIPLAKITRRGTRLGPSRLWYERTMDRLLVHLLSNDPYNL